MNYTNKYNINLLLAAWLINDDYDYNPQERVISTTTLLKPIKKAVLSAAIPEETKSVDVSELISRALGSSIHDGIEAVWRNEEKRNAALRKLGVAERLISAIRINPTDEEVKEAEEKDLFILPLYFEKRHSKDFKGWKITGKYDNVLEGIVHDTKTTSVYSARRERVIEGYRNQMSVYRWIAPHIITENYGRINFVYTDWQSSRANSDPKYPAHRFETLTIPLLSMEETEALVAEKLALREKYLGKPEDVLPPCTPDDLWMDPPTYAYYSDPMKVGIGRATKTFDGPTAKQDANAHLLEKGKGTVVERKGTAKACKFCDGADICKQREQYDTV